MKDEGNRDQAMGCSSEGAYTFYLALNNKIESRESFFYRTDLLNIDYSSLHPQPRIFENDTRTLVVLGNPLYQDKILTYAQVEQLQLDFIKDQIKNFNGQFGVYFVDKVEHCLHAFTDRTASYPVFYTQSGESLICSLSYGDIWKRVVQLKDVNQDAFYEFLQLRRLMGTKTYDCKTKYMPPFSHLEFSWQNQRLRVVRYTGMDFEKFSSSFTNQAKQLAELIQIAVDSRLADDKSYGLLLSGGLDSRVPLAVRKGIFNCFTFGYRKNNEYRVASEVAEIEHHPHHFLQLPKNLYDQLFPEAVFRCDGMRDFHSAALMAVAPQMAERNIQVVFSGSGLDYLLGDNYLPREVLFLFRRFETRIGRYRKIDTDLADFFLSTISWRYKHTPSQNLFRSTIPGEIVRHVIQKELGLAAQFSDQPLDQYLFLTLNNLSRHSMYIEGSLIRPWMEDRTPGLDKNLYDFGLRIPFAHKLNYRLYKKAVEGIDPRYLNATNANTNYKTRYNPYLTTALLFMNNIKKRCGMSAILPPDASERSWGDERQIFDNNPEIQRTLAGYKRFVMWEVLPELNVDHIGDEIEAHLSGKRPNKTLMNHLLSIETLLKDKAEKTPC